MYVGNLGEVQGLETAMACGSPIIASAPGDAARVVRESRAGLVAEPGDHADLSSAIRLLHGFDPMVREAMGRFGKEYYMDTMSARVGGSTLSGLVSVALGGTR
jgi:glycosyltransferase involved in cell wall biosynthesis